MKDYLKTLIFPGVSLAVVFFLIFLFFLPGYTESRDEVKKSYCVECHSGREGKLADLYSDWEKSSHGKKGFGCETCHGGDPGINNRQKAKAPKTGFTASPRGTGLAASCGAAGCHSTESFYFKQGPHYTRALKESKPDCSSCHGSHRIVIPGPDDIMKEGCMSCHVEEYLRVSADWYADSHRRLAEVTERAEKLGSRLSDVTDVNKGIERAGQNLHRIIHSVSTEDMKYLRHMTDLELRNIDSETYARQIHSDRLDILYIIMLAVTMSLGLGVSGYTMYMYMKRKN